MTNVLDMTKTMSGFVPPSEASARLGVHKKTLQRWAGQFFVIVPRTVLLSKAMRNQAPAKTVCALDPGVRKFLSCYDPDGQAHVLGTNTGQVLEKHVKRIRRRKRIRKQVKDVCMLERGRRQLTRTEKRRQRVTGPGRRTIERNNAPRTPFDTFTTRPLTTCFGTMRLLSYQTLMGKASFRGRSTAG